MVSERSVQPSERRLGAHHFACLRAVAEGISIKEAAEQYLAVEHALAAPSAYRAVLEQVRAIARRVGDVRWRLLGIQLEVKTPAAGPQPSLHEWADAEGLGDWSQDELLLLYEERFGAEDKTAQRRQARNARLREKRLALLRAIEAAAATQALPSDLLEGWLPEEQAELLRASGVLTLADLRERIQRGGRWWRNLRAVGPTKAGRLAKLVATLLGPIERSAWPVAMAPSELTRLSGRQGANRLAVVAGTAAGTDAEDDRQAIHAWVRARARSPYSATQYQREAERFLLWCVLERGRALSDATADDCEAYMAFIAKLPPHWISCRRVARFAPGWAPFKGQLSVASQQLAITIVSSLFAWLVKARYLAADPWVLVNRNLGDDAMQVDDDVTSRAFTPAAWAALMNTLDAAVPGPSTARLRWLCLFVQMVGLRAAELLRATRGDLVEKAAGWVIRVHGKGRRNRIVPVPKAAVEATRLYFASRGLSFDQADPEAPLLAALDNGVSPITYAALRETFQRFVSRAVGASDLPPAEKARASCASAHWLRHTYATRAAERQVPPDVLQENLGQSDPRTTARYYRAQLERRQHAMETAFDSSDLGRGS